MRIVNAYWGSWSANRPGNGRFKACNIPTTLCTHITYAYCKINDNYEIAFNEGQADKERLSDLLAYKQSTPSLKVLISVGGWAFGSTMFSKLCASSSYRATFVASTHRFLEQNRLDGLDVDWEYPGQRGGDESDRLTFVSLLSDLNRAFGSKYLLTVAVGVSEWCAKTSYDIPRIAEQVNFINLMTYDYATPNDNVVGHNAPLGSVRNTVSFWKRSGAPAKKLVMGIGFYGHSYQLADSNRSTPGSPASGKGSAGHYTREPGILGYNEICEEMPFMQQHFDDFQRVPYATKGDQWVSYDNDKSILGKTAIVVREGLGGTMIWSIDTDDFRGVSGERFPLTKTVRRWM